MLLLTNPEISAPISWPIFDMLAIQDFSDVVKDSGNCGRKIPLNDNVAPKWSPVKPPMTMDAKTWKDTINWKGIYYVAYCSMGAKKKNNLKYLTQSLLD